MAFVPLEITWLDFLAGVSGVLQFISVHEETQRISQL